MGNDETTQEQIAAALAAWLRAGIERDGSSNIDRDYLFKIRAHWTEGPQDKESLEAELKARLSDLFARTALSAIRAQAAQTLESVSQRVDIVVGLNGVQAKGEVGTVSPQSSAGVKARRFDMTLWVPVFALILQFLQGTPLWDRLVKGQTPEAQATDREMLAQAIAVALARELLMTAASQPQAGHKLVTADVPVRESPRFNSRIIGKVKRGTNVEVLTVEDSASKVRWSGPNGQAMEAWIFSRYLRSP